MAASDDSSAVVLLPLVQRHSGRAGGADDGFADEDGGLPSSAPCFLSIPALSLVLSPSLFYFGFSSVAAGGSADGGGMAVLDGVAEGHGGERGAAAGNPKMMILFSNFGPENPPCFCFFVNLPCLLSQICSSLQVRFSKVLPHLVSFFFFDSTACPSSPALSFSFPFLPRFCSLLPSALQKISPPSSFLRPILCFLFSPLYLLAAGGEVHHTLSKCRTWWHESCRVWLCRCGYGSCGIFGQVGW